MGRDGAWGLLRLRQAGWHTIAQEERGCAASGMPQAAIELGAAVEVLSLERIGDSLVQRLGRVGARNRLSRSGRDFP
jgi:two-component system response regulator WspF